MGREYNDRTVSCWSVGDSRREESSDSGSSDLEGEARKRGFRQGSGSRPQEGDGCSEAGSGNVVHFERELAAMPKKLVKAIAKGKYVDFGRFPILRDFDGAKEEWESMVATGKGKKPLQVIPYWLVA